MADYTEQSANEIAELALADEDASGDPKIVQRIGEIMGASSQTLEEAFLTAVRVRRAERRARELLAERATERAAVGDDTAAPAEDAPKADAS